LSADTETAPADDATAIEQDDLRSGLLASLEAELGDAVVDTHLKPGIGLWVRVTADAWATAGGVAKATLGCAWFDFLSTIDWLPSPFGRYEDAEFDTAESLRAKVAAVHAAFATEKVTGVAGGDTRFQLLAHVVNVIDHHDVFLKADVPEDTLTMPTWSKLYAGANWHEREAWEMYGIAFDGHPDLRKLYLPSEFEGHPGRKDYPLLARIVKPWPGVVDVEQMPGVAAEDEPAEGEEG
jgi:NADH-quinone oxidoreductase subunit C